MELKVYEEKHKDKWNNYISESPYGNILQSWEWGEVKAGKEWQVMRLGVLHKRKVIGLVQILERELPFHFKIFYSPYGPVFDWESPHADEFLKTIVNYLKEKTDNRYLFWKIEPRIEREKAKMWKVESTLVTLGFEKQEKSIQPEYTSIVDLTREEKEIIGSFEKDTRYSIRRAEREGLEVREFENPLNSQPVREFYDLYSLTSERGKFPGRTWEQFERIWEEMAPQKVRIFQVWYKENILASAMVFTFGEKAFLIYAGSLRDEEYKKMFATYFLQWKIMTALKEKGYKTYDMWGVVPEQEKDHPWAGISLFKRGFRGEEKEFLGAWDLPLSPFYRIYRMINDLRYSMKGNR